MASEMIETSSHLETVWTYATRPGRAATPPHYNAYLAGWVTGPSEVPETVREMFYRICAAHERWEQLSEEGKVRDVYLYRKTPKMEIPEGIPGDAIYVPEYDWINAGGHHDIYIKIVSKGHPYVNAHELRSYLDDEGSPFAALSEIHKAHRDSDDSDEREDDDDEDQESGDEEDEDVDTGASVTADDEIEDDEVESVEDSDEEMSSANPTNRTETATGQATIDVEMKEDEEVLKANPTNRTEPPSHQVTIANATSAPTHNPEGASNSRLPSRATVSELKASAARARRARISSNRKSMHRRANAHTSGFQTRIGSGDSNNGEPDEDEIDASMRDMGEGEYGEDPDEENTSRRYTRRGGYGEDPDEKEDYAGFYAKYPDLDS